MFVWTCVVRAFTGRRCACTTCRRSIRRSEGRSSRSRTPSPPGRESPTTTTSTVILFRRRVSQNNTFMHILLLNCYLISSTTHFHSHWNHTYFAKFLTLPLCKCGFIQRFIFFYPISWRCNAWSFCWSVDYSHYEFFCNEHVNVMYM